MTWLFVTILTGAVAAFPVGALVYRKFRQRTIAKEMKVRGADGIVEERFVKIGGIEQWIGIRGQDRANPVLLLIHGGPGSSYAIFAPVIRSWERYFTVVQWDQRGSGRTLRRTGRVGTGELTLDRLACDGVEVAEYIRTRLRKDKVILLASSFGSTFGLSMVKRRPDVFSAYVGTDQNIGMVRGRVENHRATLERLKSIGLNRGVAALTKIGPDPSRWTPKDFSTIAQWTMKSDPRTCKQIMKLLKTSIWYAPGYTLRDIKDFVTGMHFSLDRLFPEVPGQDAWQQGVQFEIPFFIIQGENDVLTPTHLAEAYFRDVVAPVKHMTLIPEAGHFAAFARPEEFLSELLTHVRPLFIAP